MAASSLGKTPRGGRLEENAQGDGRYCISNFYANLDYDPGLHPSGRCRIPVWGSVGLMVASNPRAPLLLTLIVESWFLWFALAFCGVSSLDYDLVPG
jgi:hypothetical protein